MTGEINWNGEWTEKQSLPEVLSPKINGYIPDKSRVDALLLGHEDEDKEITVTYRKSDQSAKLILIDDDLKSEMQHLDATGKFGEDIVFGTDIDALIEHYEEKGYELVSNNFKDQKYQADNTQNQFEIHFKHKKQKVYETKKINETIHYMDEDGHQVFGDYKASPLVFERQGMKDMVTGDADWEEWTKDQIFDAVESPTLEGYEAEPEKIDEQTVDFESSDLEFTVIYKKLYRQGLTVRPHDDPPVPQKHKIQEPIIPTLHPEKPEEEEVVEEDPRLPKKTKEKSQIVANKTVVFDETDPPKQAQAPILPQTDNEQSSAFSLTGMALSLASLIGLVRRKKNHK